MTTIRYEVDDGIATVTIDRPEKRNAMTYAILAEFREAIVRAGQDPAARAVVVTGAGGAFCAGTDLSDLAGTPEEARSNGGAAAAGSPAGSPAGEDGGQDPLAWIAWFLVGCPKPVVGAIDGPAVGMGAEFATQCDVRIASTRARFAWNFVHRGLIPDTGAGSFLLPRLVGPTAALRILYSGEFVGAEEARELGFVADVVEPEDLLDAARAEARRFLVGSPFAIARVKRLVYEGMALPLDDHLRNTRARLEECFRSDDHREGVAAFLERREAHFTGT